MQSPYGYPYPPVYQPHNQDLEHLKILRICHYVLGGLQLAFSCFAIIYIVLGTMMLRNPDFFGKQGQGEPPPAFLGWFFIGCGSGVLLFGWVVGLLNIYSGRGMAKLRRRTFSLVMAGINCVHVPLGTILGVFTFIVLLRESVKALYQAPPPPPGAPPAPGDGIPFASRGPA